MKRVLSVAHASQPVERAEDLEYRNQLPGVCWGTVYCSIESIFLNHPVFRKNYFYINKVGTSPKNGRSFFTNYSVNATHKTRALDVDHVQSTASTITQTQDHNLHSTKDNVNISYTNFAYGDYMFGTNFMMGRLAPLQHQGL